MTPEVETAGVELVKAETLNAVQVFTGGGMNAILDRIEATVRAIELDGSTAEGRDQIRSVAYKVVRTKTTLDAEGKKLTEEWRKNTTKVNEERKKAAERLDALAEEVRKPLTDFENKEKIRVAAHEAAIAEMAGALELLQRYPDMAAVALEEHLLDFAGLHADRDWEEFADRAKRLRHEVSAAFIRRIEARKKYEAEQAELARLRQEEAERKQRERDEALKAQAAELARLEAERVAKEAAEAERRRVAAEAETERKRVADEQERVRLEHERVQREAERARLEVEKRARDAEEARVAAERKADAARVEAKRKADAAKAKAAADLEAARVKAKADLDAAVTKERERVERERRVAEESRLKREADEANKVRIRREIVEDLTALDAADMDYVLEIADAIMAGRVRNVRVQY